MYIGARPSMCVFTTKFLAEKEPSVVQVEYILDHVVGRPEAVVSSSILSVPLDPQVSTLVEYPVSLPFGPCMAYDMGSECNEWFSERFGYPVKLLYIGPHRRKAPGNLNPRSEAQWSLTRRTIVRLVLTMTFVVLCGTLAYLSSGFTTWPHVKWIVLSSSSICIGSVVQNFVPDRGSKISDGSDTLTFTDLAPFLVISFRSLEDIRSRLASPSNLDAARFRPSIVVDGAQEAFEEDYWSELQVGKLLRLSLTQNCARCSSLNVDYSTGKIGVGDAGQVLKHLSKYRRVDPGTKWSPVFGRYGFFKPGLPSTQGRYLIRVGDNIDVVKRALERTIIGESGHALNHKTQLIKYRAS